MEWVDERVEKVVDGGRGWLLESRWTMGEEWECSENRAEGNGIMWSLGTGKSSAARGGMLIRGGMLWIFIKGGDGCCWKNMAGS